MRCPASAVLAVLVLSASAAPAEDDPDTKKRLEYMQAMVASLVPESAELKSKASLALVAKPLLRYNDPTRGGVKSEAEVNLLLDATVWRLGTEGRPTALVTLEFYQAPNGSRLLAYEFLSLTQSKFSLKHKTQTVRWDATASGLHLKELPEAPKPGATAAARLVQMRQLVRRFGAKEQFNKEQIECRLLAQPLDRYQSEADKITDGAIFALANGTNPEIGILLETDGERWKYGILRLGAAASKVYLDEKEILAYAQFDHHGRRDGAYNNGAHKIEMDK
jgi:hypothetical protein